MRRGNVSRQVGTALRIGAAGLRRRWWSSLNAALGTAVVVGVLIALLAIGAGYADALRLASSDDNLLIMRFGVRSEMESSLTSDQVAAILKAPQFAGLGGRPQAAAEVYAVANIEAGVDGKMMNVAVRGIGPSSLLLRRGVKLVEGRMFEPGRREIVVGRLAQRRFNGLGVGKNFHFAGGEWTVVGVFESNGSMAESEVWADAPMVQTAYNRGGSYSVVLASGRAGARLSDTEAALNRDPRVNVRVERQSEYYADQAASMQRFVRTLSYGIGFLMALGAIFASLNTGFAHVKARSKELATLAALGWSNRGLMAAVAGETLALSLLGAVCGALIAQLLFDGRVVSTLFYSKDFAQVVFAFSVTTGVLAQAALVALVIGAAGMIGPALQVRRIPISRVLANRH